MFKEFTLQARSVPWRELHAEMSHARVPTFSPITLLYVNTWIPKKTGDARNNGWHTGYGMPTNLAVIFSSSLLGGYRNNNGNFNNLNTNSNYWSASQNNETNAWNLNINSNNEKANVNNNNKGCGFSVRCVSTD